MYRNELIVDNLLLNSWVKHAGCQIYREGHIVHVNLAIKNGINTLVLTLPEGFRPAQTTYFSATTQTKGIYCSIDSSGKLYIPSANVGELIFASFSYYVP